MSEENRKFVVVDPDTPRIKARRKLIATPKVKRFRDFKGGGLLRVLERSNDLFPEFALYMRSGGSMVLGSLEDAGFKEEERGKWVLRTNRFSIFVYV